MKTLSELERRKGEIEASIAGEKKRHESTVSAYNSELADVQRQIGLKLHGLDTELVSLARTVIYWGKYSRGGCDRQSVIDDAVKDLLEGAPKLRQNFFGTKDYAHWSGQRSDHSYGFGPSHGSTVFSVGLTQEARKRDLTPNEIDAAIYVIRNIERIETATTF